MALPPGKLPIDASFLLNDFYCKCSIGGVEFLPQNIDYVNITESIFDIIPKLEMRIIDIGRFAEQFPLEDGDIIKVVLAQSNIVTPIIDMEFILHDYKIDNLDGDKINQCAITMTGYLKSKDMFFQKTRSFKNSTSVDVLKTIASENNYSLDVRTKTADVMNWIQPSSTNYSMISETLQRAYKDDDSLYAVVTRDSKFIISSLATEQKNKTVKSAVFDPLKALSNTISEDVPIYYNNFSNYNVMGTNNFQYGYGVNYYQYDFNTVTKNKIDSTKHLLTKLAYKNKDNVGKLDHNFPIRTYNNKNTHKNYVKAIAQNDYNYSELFKNSFVLYTNPNKALNIGDILNVNMPSFDETQNVNQVMSGRYFVSGISYQASKQGFFKSAVTLMRSGFNESSSVQNANYTSVK